MNARALLETVSGCGVRLYANGDRLDYEGPADVVNGDLLNLLRYHKAELLALLTSNDPEQHDIESVREWYEERAAILQFDGGLTANDADQQARGLTLARFGLPANYKLH